MARSERKPMPPLGEPVRASQGVWRVEDIGPDWQIVARRAAGQGNWQFLLEREAQLVFRTMVNDGVITTVQRRDPKETVLLTKLVQP